MKKYPGYKHMTEYDMMREVGSYKELFPLMNEKVVLDIGANTGAFSYQSLRNGARKVYSVEPSPRNLEHLLQQPFIKRFKEKGRVVVVKKAIVQGSEKSTTFYEGSGKNTGLDGIYKRRNLKQKEVDVESVSFEKILNDTQPDILKIDVEGSEKSYDFTLLPGSVQAIAIEIHLVFFRQEGYENWYEEEENKYTGCSLREYLEKRFPKVLKYKENRIFGKLATIEVVLSK